MVNIGKNQVASINPVTPAKVIEFQNNDTATRVCSLAGLISPNAVAIIIVCARPSGTGSLKVYPCSGDVAITMAVGESAVVVFAEGTQDFKFANSVNNDDWDVYLLSEILEGPVGGE